MKRRASLLWIVGKNDKDWEVNDWYFCGVFDSEEKAVRYCIDANKIDHNSELIWIAPAILNDEDYATEPYDWKGLYFPLLSPKSEFAHLLEEIEEE